MTKGTFTYALDKIDSAYISEALNYSEEKERTQKTRSLALKIASAAACVAIVLVGALDITMRKTPANVENPDLKIGQEMIIDPVSSDKVSTGHKIGIKCLSFYQSKTITIDCFMSQMLTEDEKTQIDGYPVFEVYQETQDNTENGNGNVIIGGKGNNYEKKFTLDDLSFLAVSSSQIDVFDGHSEKIVLDFSNFKTGEAATVTFSYGFFYYKNNPYNQFQPDNSWCGMRRSLYFYCGENGISVSSNGIEDSISNYEECNIEISPDPDSDVQL